MELISNEKYIDTLPCWKQSGSGSGDIVLGFDKSDANFNLILNLENYKIYDNQERITMRKKIISV